MRVLLIGLLVICAVSSTYGQSGPTTQPEYGPIPVAWTGYPSNPNGDLPLVTVGRIETQTAMGPEQDAWRDAYYTSFEDNQFGFRGRDDPNAQEFAALGKGALLPAVAGHDLILALASPLGKSSVTTSVLKEGNTLVLRVKYWKSNELAHAKTPPPQLIQMIYIPPLSKGSYRLQVQWFEMTQDAPNEGSAWTCTDERVGETPLEIPAGANYPSISFNDLRPAKMPPSDVREQSPWEMTSRQAPVGPPPSSELTVGTLDQAKLFTTDLAKLREGGSIPAVSPPVSDESTYAVIVGPPIQTAEWASIDSVQWSGTEATIYCFLWTDTGDRLKNIPSRPLLILALRPPAAKPALLPITPAGHYKVTLVWHKLVAPSPGGWYATASGGDTTTSTTFDVR